MDISFTDAEVIDMVVHQSSRYMQFSTVVRQEIDQRFANIMSNSDEEDQYVDEDFDEDFVPDESDVEMDRAVEYDIRDDSDEGDSELEDVEEDPLPVAVAVAQTLGGKFYTSRDGKQWSLDAIPAAGRIRQHNILRTKRCGPLPGTVANPVTIFRSIMTPAIVDIIVRETNRRANEVIEKWNADNPNRIQSWTCTNEKEMYAYFGLLLFAGVFGSNKQPIKELWAPYNHSIYKGTMSLKRFVHITRYIRFDNSATRAQRLLTSKSAPIDDVWLMLMANLERAYKPHENLTVDEQLFPFRGRTRFTQYIPSKPAKYGIKVWWVCDAKSHFPLKGIIYTGKLEGAEREKNQGENVVMKLVSQYHHSGRTVYEDNFFTSMNLATHLMSVSLSFVGTVRSNKRFIPDELRLNKNKPRELYSTLFCSYNNDVVLCSYAAKKKKLVFVLSTEHYTNTVDSRTTAAKPQQILDYNVNKAGVDTMDQMVTGYTCKRSTNRWPLAVFFNMIDISGLASFIIHDELAPKKQSDRRRAFIIELCTQLVVPQMEERAKNPNIVRFPHIQQALKTYGAMPPTAAVTVPPQEYRPGSCAICLNETRKHRKTRFRCQQCDDPVCLTHANVYHKCHKCIQ